MAVVLDVADDPFCLLPLHVWTHDVGKGLNSVEWKRFEWILDSFSKLMVQLLSETHGDGGGRLSSSLNCGGAALAALASEVLFSVWKRS